MIRYFEKILFPRHPTVFRSYMVALLLPLLALGLRLLLWPVMESFVPFLVFNLAVTMVAAYGGFKPGVFATALSAALCVFFLIPPTFSFRLETAAEVIGVVIFLVSGTVISAICEVMHRIQPHIERQNSDLRRAEQRYRCLAEATTALIWTANAERQFDTPQPSWESYTGQPREDYLHKPYAWLAMYHPEEREAVRQAWEECLRFRTPFHRETRMWCARYQQWRYVESRAIRIFNGKQTDLTEWVGCVFDIHDRKEIENERKTAERNKDEFIALLSHELRNPLSPILSSLFVVRRTQENFPPQVADALDIIERQAKQLSRLVEDLLDVTRINKGKIQLSLAPVCLCEVLKTVTDSFTPAMERKNHRFVYEPFHERLVIKGDSVRLTQIFSNILHNASKYTEPGGIIRVGCDREGEFGAVKISDNGRGIGPDMLAHVFDMFFRGQPSTGSRDAGLGIGLTLVKKLVELHHGMVKVESAGEGRGTTVTAMFPLVGESPDVPTSLTLPQPAAGAKRVLVVDDNEDAATATANVMRVSGYEVKVALSGEQGLSLLPDFNPDIILLDIGMPGMDGYQVCTHLRSNGYRFPVVALTGFGTDNDRMRSQQSGFNYHLVKPVEPELLADTVKRLLENANDV